MNERIAETMRLANLIRPKMDRYVYVIGGDGGTTKVGIARTPAKRLRDIKTNSGRFDLRVLKTWPCGAWCRYVEIQVHLLLQQHKAGGEWFNISPEDACALVAEVVKTLTTVREPEPGKKQVVVPMIPKACAPKERQSYGKRRWLKMARVQPRAL